MVTELFNTLEQKLELILAQMARFQEANAALEKALAAKEQALQEAQATLQQVTQEREVVRQRIDKILNRLTFLDVGESA